MFPSFRDGSTRFLDACDRAYRYADNLAIDG